MSTPAIIVTFKQDLKSMYIPQTLYIEVRESSLQFLQKKHYNLNDQGRKETICRRKAAFQKRSSAQKWKILNNSGRVNFLYLNV